MFDRLKTSIKNLQFYRAVIPAMLAAWLLSGCGSNAAPNTVVAVQPPQPTVTQFVFPPTYTPTLPGPPTASPTMRATRTPLPTATQAPTLAPSATPVFDVLQASDEQLPFISSSLLYLKDGELMVWDFLSLEKYALNADELPAGLTDVSYSSGAFVVAAAGGVEAGQIEIHLYNRFSEVVSFNFSIESSGLDHIALSPDAAYLALIVREAVETETVRIPTATPQPTATEEEGSATPSPGPTATTSKETELDEKRVLYLIDLLAQGAPVEVAECERLCSEVLWNPSSSGFFYGDDGGLWFADADAAPDRLLEPFLTGVSAATEKRDSFLPLSISPSGRYLILRKGLEVGSVLAVYDLVEGALENLPGTGSYTGSGTGHTWMFGDLLAIARSGNARLELSPAIEIWQVASGAQAGMFSLFGRYVISDDPGVVLDSPVQLADGRLAFSVNHYQLPDSPVVNGLYMLDAASGMIVQVNYLPIVRVESMQWLPDASAALIQTSNRLLLVPAGFGQIYSLQAFLGTQSCCFIWMP